LPPMELLEPDSGLPNSGDIKNNALLIKKTLNNFGVDVEMSAVVRARIPARGEGFVFVHNFDEGSEVYKKIGVLIGKINKYIWDKKRLAEESRAMEIEVDY